MEQREGVFEGYQDIKLYYQCWLPHEELCGVVVFIHGFGDHSGRHGKLVQAVCEKGWAFYGCDLRGHGQSPGQRGYIGSWDEYREDVRRFIEFVHTKFPTLPLFLMGYSMGGLLVLNYGLHYRDHLQGIIAMGPAIGDVGISPVLMFFAKILDKLWPRFSLEAGLESDGLCRDEKVVEEIENDPLSHGKGTPRLGTELLKVRAWTRANAFDWKLPLLLLHGKADRIAYPEETEQFFSTVSSSDKTIKLYEGAYHELDSEPNKNEVFRDIVTWLEEHRRKELRSVREGGLGNDESTDA